MILYYYDSKAFSSESFKEFLYGHIKKISLEIVKKNSWSHIIYHLSEILKAIYNFSFILSALFFNGCLANKGRRSDVIKDRSTKVECRSDWKKTFAFWKTYPWATLMSSFTKGIYSFWEKFIINSNFFLQALIPYTGFPNKKPDFT